MFHTPAHKSQSAGQVTPGLAELHALADAQNPSEDFRLADHGSVFILTPVTEAAKSWAEEHLPPGAMRWAGGVAIEARFVGDIVDGINGDGLGIAA